MFETAVLRRHGEGFTAVDSGLLAETLLFYSRVHIVAHDGVLVDLLRTVGAETLMSLVEQKRVSVTFLRANYATLSVNQSGLAFHSFGEYTPHATEAKKKITNEESVVMCFERALGQSWASRRLAKRFLKLIKVRKSIEAPEHSRGIPGLATEDLLDVNYVQEAMRSLLVETVPSYPLPARFRFEVRFVEDGSFLIHHNIDMDALNRAFKEHHPSSGSTITSALLIGQLLEARTDLQLGSRYMAEIVTSEATAAVMRKRLLSMVRRRDQSASEIDMFQRAELENGRAIREAINSGERTFDEFMKLLDKSAKFKHWLGGQNPDANLLKEYYEAISAESWLGSLPAKFVRFIFLTGLSAVDSGGGLAAGAADTFVLDKIFKGWRPNQFINGPVRKFVSG